MVAAIIFTVDHESVQALRIAGCQTELGTAFVLHYWEFRSMFKTRA